MSWVSIPDHRSRVSDSSGSTTKETFVPNATCTELNKCFLFGQFYKFNNIAKVVAADNAHLH